MKESLQIFNFNDNNIRTFIDDRDNIWFCLKDVCDVLEINNSRDVVSRLDNDDVVSIDGVDSKGRKNLMNFVNESGLYQVTFQSRKTIAKQFTKWITHDVIPNIRQKGYHIEKNLSGMEYAKMMLELSQNLVKMEEEKLQLQEQNQMLLPKAESYDDFMNSDNLMSINEVAKILKGKGVDIGEVRLFKFLRQQGILYYSGGCNVPKQKYLELGYFKVKEKMVDEIGNKQTTFVTKKGFEYIQKKVSKEYKGGKL